MGAVVGNSASTEGVLDRRNWFWDGGPVFRKRRGVPERTVGGSPNPDLGAEADGRGDNLRAPEPCTL